MKARRLVGDQARHEFRRKAIRGRLYSDAPAPDTPCTRSSNAGLWPYGPLRCVAQRVGVDDRRIDLLQVVVAQPQPLDRRFGRLLWMKRSAPLIMPFRISTARSFLRSRRCERLLRFRRHVDPAPCSCRCPSIRPQTLAQQIALQQLDLDHRRRPCRPDAASRTAPAGPPSDRSPSRPPKVPAFSVPIVVALSYSEFPPHSYGEVSRYSATEGSSAATSLWPTTPPPAYDAGTSPSEWGGE